MDAELTKAQVLATLQTERRAWDALLAEVGDARMSTLLPGDQGSPRDILAHVAWYEQETAAVLQAGPPPAERAWLWELPESQRNLILYREQSLRSLAEVRAAAQAAFTQLLAAVEALDAETAHDPARFPTMPATWTPWQFIAAHSYEHYRAHTPALRAWLDTLPAAPPPPVVALPDYAPASVLESIAETVRVQHRGATVAERSAIEQGLLADLGYTPR